MFLFSNHRNSIENHKYTETCNDANKVIAKYKRQCEKKKKPKCLMNILIIYMNIIQHKTHYKKSVLSQSKTEVRTKLVYYSDLIIKIWQLIPKLHVHIKDFTTAILYIFKRGLIVNSVVLIPKDFYLEEALPEANSLDEYGIVKPIFTHAKNEIMQAIRRNITKNELFMRNFISIFE